VSADRRVVRATSGFFEDLDGQLGPEHGPNGEPSSNDFQVFELFRIIEQFAIGFDDLPQPIPGRPDYRILIAAGTVVPATPSPRSSRPTATSS
jgi:hypothetical protein